MCVCVRACVCVCVRERVLLLHVSIQTELRIRVGGVTRTMMGSHFSLLAHGVCERMGPHV